MLNSLLIEIKKHSIFQFVWKESSNHHPSIVQRSTLMGMHKNLIDYDKRAMACCLAFIHHSLWNILVASFILIIMYAIMVFINNKISWKRKLAGAPISKDAPHYLRKKEKKLTWIIMLWHWICVGFAKLTNGTLSYGNQFRRWFA